MKKGFFIIFVFIALLSLVACSSSPPQLYVGLSVGETPMQHLRAIQGSVLWDVGDRSFSATDLHPLDLWALDLADFLPMDISEITFQLDGSDGEVRLQFRGGFPPRSVHVRRWNAEVARSVDGGGSDMDLWSQYESIEIKNNRFQISNDGNDYIYDVKAVWGQGYSSYAFRIDS